MKRIFDLIFLIPIILLFFFPFIIINIFLIFLVKGNIYYWSDRVGKNNKIFRMPKFRTMRIDTPQLASNLLIEPNKYLIPCGNFLRKTSLDELPQIWSIMKGDMSFVGPRPALFNEKELIKLRTNVGVHKLLPGLTGWAQVNGRDLINPQQKVVLDTIYLNKMSLLFDIRILFITIIKVLKKEGVSF